VGKWICTKLTVGLAVEFDSF